MKIKKQDGRIQFDVPFNPRKIAMWAAAIGIATFTVGAVIGLFYTTSWIGSAIIAPIFNWIGANWLWIFIGGVGVGVTSLAFKAGETKARLERGSQTAQNLVEGEQRIYPSSSNQLPKKEGGGYISQSSKRGNMFLPPKKN